MSIFSEFHQKFIITLSHCGVKFLLIGGQAAIFYGVRRGTGDLDILIEPTKENGIKILQTFKQLELQIEDIQAEEFEKSLFLGVGFEPDAVDILTMTPGVDFNSAYSRAKEINDGNLSIKLIDIRDLIRNKEALKREGEKRLLDEYDVAVLKRILKDNPTRFE